MSIYILIFYGHLNLTKTCRMCPLITGQYPLLQIPTKTWKFCGNGQVPQLKILSKIVGSINNKNCLVDTEVLTLASTAERSGCVPEVQGMQLLP